MVQIPGKYFEIENQKSSDASFWHRLDLVMATRNHHRIGLNEEALAKGLAEGTAKGKNGNARTVRNGKPRPTRCKNAGKPQQQIRNTATKTLPTDLLFELMFVTC